MPSLSSGNGESNVKSSDSIENNGFLPSIFKATSSSESDMEALSGSLSPTTRRGSRGSSLTSPTKLPTIDRSSTNSVSSVASLTSLASSRRQHRSDICRSPSCPQLWTGDTPEMMSSRELKKFALKNTHKGVDLSIKLPDIRNKKEGKQAKYLAMKREQWLEKQNRKRNSGGTPRKSSSSDVSDLMISPRNKIQNPVLLPMDLTSNKENDNKKGKKKKLKASKPDSRKTVLSESKSSSVKDLNMSNCERPTGDNKIDSNKQNDNVNTDVNKVESSKLAAQNSVAQTDSISSERAAKSTLATTQATAEVTPVPEVSEVQNGGST